jgi:hypothetical protein
MTSLWQVDNLKGALGIFNDAVGKVTGAKVAAGEKRENAPVSRLLEITRERVDWQLQESLKQTLTTQYFNAIQSHTLYFNQRDVAAFVKSKVLCQKSTLEDNSGILVDI